MKKIVAALALWACSQGALAAGPDCRAIKSTDERLACYDAAVVPPKKDRPSPTVTEDDAQRAAYKDPLIEEDARMATKLKTICRGC